MDPDLKTEQLNTEAYNREDVHVCGAFLGVADTLKWWKRHF